MKVITEKLKEARKDYEQKVKDLLMGKYPYLYFYVSPTGNLSVWVRRNGKDGAAIQIKNSNLFVFDEDYFDELNQKVKPAAVERDKYFLCSECGEVKPISEYESSVMAAEYCKKCAEKPAIKDLIIESKRSGFYD